MNIPVDHIEWKEVKYLRQGQTSNYDYHLLLNKPLADWDVYDYWERERVESMRNNLKKGDILFDIGTEQGWLDLVYGHIVGPENMVLIEPTPEFWPNIRTLWEKNFGNILPKGCYDGLMSDKTTDKRNLSGIWTESSVGDLIDRNSYKLIHEHGEVIPQMKIDDYVRMTGIIPKAFTIDVEGAELLVLRGAEETLKNHNLKVWVSIHTDLAKQYYDVKDRDVHQYMERLGYKGIYLATDHESHWFYQKA